MIFSIADHIEQIKAGTKTQTRRHSDRYKLGSLLAIQPKRGMKGISDGKIKIIKKTLETKAMTLSKEDAESEGGYGVDEYEELYEKMYPHWLIRYCYEFEYISELT